jgi:hypothetical protein
MTASTYAAVLRCHSIRSVRILVDVGSERLRAELLERAGHTIEYGEAARARPFGSRWSSVDAMVARIYSDLFLMPVDDPALGLDVPDPFSDAHAMA